MKAEDVISMGIIGISDSLGVCVGFDQQVFVASIGATKPELYDDDEWDDMPPEEKVKLADFMISRWSRYRNAALEHGWTRWYGGDCPVYEDTLLYIQLEDGYMPPDPMRAGECRWYHRNDGGDIVAYRIAQ